MKTSTNETTNYFNSNANFLPKKLIDGSKTVAEYFELAVERSGAEDRRASGGPAAFDLDVLASSSWSNF